MVGDRSRLQRGRAVREDVIVGLVAELISLGEALVAGRRGPVARHDGPSTLGQYEGVGYRTERMGRKSVVYFGLWHLYFRGWPSRESDRAVPRGSPKEERGKKEGNNNTNELIGVAQQL